MNSFRPSNAAILTFVFLVAIVVSALYDLQPPSPLPATAPDSLFSADRAAGYIRDIAREPHPLGSLANQRVRDYIVGQLIDIGLKPQLDTAVVTGSYAGIHYAASVVNIVARISGTANTRAVALMAHYDSVPTGPGASDDGSGVATILETLRALKASHPLKNAVVAIFTDGEENGMLGGQAVSENKELMSQIGVVLNFEARGTSGPTLMFETSPDSSSGNGNGWLITQLAAAGCHPVATSISNYVYRHLPNNTDFSWLKAKGAAGFNFAFIGNAARYHSEMDNYSNVDEASLQHDGSYALALTKRLGNEKLPGPEYVNYVYFNFFWPGFVTYPSSTTTAITVLAVILFALTFYVGSAKKVIKPIKSLISLFISLALLAMVGLISFFAWKGLVKIYPESAHFLLDTFYNNGEFLCALISIVVALTTAFYIFIRKYFRSSEMAMGSLFIWLALAIASTYFFPRGAYLFQWPLIFSSFALLVFFLGPKSDFRSPIVLLLLLLCAIPGVYLITSSVYLIYLTGLSPVSTTSVILLVLLGMYTLLPHIAVIASTKKWILPALAAVAAVGFAATALLTHDIDQHHPNSDSIEYAIDLNDSTAYWISFDDSTDGWTSQFMRNRVSMDSIPDFFPDWWSTPRMASKGAPASVTPASITMTGDSTFRGAQFMQLLVKPGAGTQNITLIGEEGGQVLSSSFDGQPLADSSALYPAGKRDRWTLRCFGIPDSGSTITLVIPVGQRFSLTAVEVVDGLPQAGELPSYPRPASIIPRPFVTTDASVVVKSYTF